MPAAAVNRQREKAQRLRPAAPRSRCLLAARTPGRDDGAGETAPQGRSRYRSSRACCSRGFLSHVEVHPHFRLTVATSANFLHFGPARGGNFGALRPARSAFFGTLSFPLQPRLTPTSYPVPQRCVVPPVSGPQKCPFHSPDARRERAGLTRLVCRTDRDHSSRL